MTLRQTRHGYVSGCSPTYLYIKSVFPYFED